jgi:hypothetical protein
MPARARVTIGCCGACACLDARREVDVVVPVGSPCAGDEAGVAVVADVEGDVVASCVESSYVGGDGVVSYVGDVGVASRAAGDDVGAAEAGSPWPRVDVDAACGGEGGDVPEMVGAVA